MTSVTGDFSSAIKNGTDNIIIPRNAMSTTRRKCIRRKILKIMPLKLEELQKELDSDSDTQADSNTSCKENILKNDSFDVDFSVLSKQTPIKKAKEPIKDGDFATPYKPQIVSQKSNRMLDYKYETPCNKIIPKVQCSVNMQNYLKTPIEKVGVPHNDSDSKSQLESPIPSFKTIKINNREYVILNDLGKGGSSEVFHCYDQKNNAHRAIKCVSLHDPASATGFINEVQMLKTLQKCNRIIRMFDFEVNQKAKTLLVVLEVGGADLSKILKESAKETAHMPVYMLIYYWMEMLYAVQQIHANGIIHSDLKPANFLKVEGYLKLIDFGIASCVQTDMTSVIKGVPEGSLNYISPEALNNESNNGSAKYKVSFKSDVWSLGCILYQMVYRRTPFQHVTHMWVKIGTLLDPNHEIEYPEAHWVPPKIIGTIKKCLQYNIKLRPSVNDLIDEYENIFQNLC